jgi:hypothetical protein
MVRDGQAYCEFLSELIAWNTRLYGRVALSRAREVPGLGIEGEPGRVTRIDGDPVVAIEALLKQFERMGGKVSTIQARGIIRQLDLLARYPDLELPAALRW